ncbi:MAG: histidine phosphatase family protein, partial [Deltaproteobacteria bacterium]|nr:histidine phosphatase family protein [Deltaproteobacteria bacterium]
MKLILARHGQTEANQNKFVMGRTDSPLTPLGFKTAQDLALVLASEKLAAVFSSPLGRAAASAEIYAQGRSLPVQHRPALAELSAGQWEGRPWAEVVGQWTILRSGWTDRPPGGESYQDGEVRLRPFMDELQAFKQ